MLTVARERGIARYWVEPYEPRDAELESRLTKRFELNSVAVITTPPGASPHDKRQFVAHFGSSFISALISPRSDVVVAGRADDRRTCQPHSPQIPTGMSPCCKLSESWGPIWSTSMLWSLDKPSRSRWGRFVS